MSESDKTPQTEVDPILKQLILEGLDSPSEEMTDADWQRMRDGLRRRFGNRGE